MVESRGDASRRCSCLHAAHPCPTATQPPAPLPLQDTQLYTLVFSLSLLVASAAVAALLTARLGRRMGLKLMYALAVIPGVVLLQVCVFAGLPAACLSCTCLPASPATALWQPPLTSSIPHTPSTAPQVVLLLHASAAGLWIAATVLGGLYIRQSLVGLLCLHTLPTREAYSLVRTLQVRRAHKIALLRVQLQAPVPPAAAGSGRWSVAAN